MRTNHAVKSAFESMMFLWGKPLQAKIAGELFQMTERQALEIFTELQGEYEMQQGGLRIRRVGNGFQFVTASENAGYLDRLCTPVKKRRLSQSALEVLAIIAYQQPVTRGQMEEIRGIKCERVLDGLMKKGLIEEQGRSDGIGRPILYGTTDAFLKHFGLETLRDLPDIEEVERAVEAPDDTGNAVIRNQLSIEDLPQHRLAGTVTADGADCSGQHAENSTDRK